MNTTNKTLKRLVVLMTALIGLSAQAGVLVEPYLGIATAGDGKSKSGSTRVEYDHDIAPTAGLRAGYSMWGAMLGLDASYQKTTVESQSLVSTSIIPYGESDIDKTQVGVFLGYNLPMPMRVWVSYYFMGEMKFENDSKFTSGNGYAFEPVILDFLL